jgi:predicted transcriptional regulator
MVAITFKVSPDEARQLRRAAQAAKRSVSAHIRAAVFPPPRPRRRKRIIKKHPVSGLPYDATDEGGPVVTLEQIKEALADFP